ncbi:hypothetical protein PIB30_009109 [Stylosanthes scabra]|uniref:Uncharacterized protein n=1 Tax=Stylosanthes scabra TaxID=79078 RepID=A0ABU6W4I4_9FABA|nr:hypothetical protein [Stylosanthes scabra]
MTNHLWMDLSSIKGFATVYWIAACTRWNLNSDTYLSRLITPGHLQMSFGRINFNNETSNPKVPSRLKAVINTAQLGFSNITSIEFHFKSTYSFSLVSPKEPSTA